MKMSKDRNIIIVISIVMFLSTILLECTVFVDKKYDRTVEKVFNPDTIAVQAAQDKPLEITPEIVILNPTELCW